MDVPSLYRPRLEARCVCVGVDGGDVCKGVV
jgi:hypothetical protein